MAKKRASASYAAAAWRLLLIPFAYVLWRLLPLYDVETLAFAGRFRDCWGRGEFTLSFIVLGVSLIGLIGLVVTPARKRLLEGLWLILLLMPVWYKGSLTADAEGAKYLAKFDGNAVLIACGVLFSLWSLVMVRGEVKTEWIRIVLAVVLIALDGYLMRGEGDGANRWMNVYSILALSVLTGWAVDWVNSGLSLAGALPAAVIVIGLLLSFTDLSRLYRLYVMAGLCAVFAVILLVRSPAKRRSFGSIFALLGVGFCAFTGIMLFH